jgi:hypothetical protein
MLYVVPSLALTVVMTSDAGTRSFDGGYLCELHDLLALELIPAFLPGHPVGDDSALCAPPQLPLAGSPEDPRAVPATGLAGGGSRELRK